MQTHIVLRNHKHQTEHAIRDMKFSSFSKFSFYALSLHENAEQGVRLRHTSIMSVL